MIDMYLLMEKVSNPVKCSLLTLDVNDGATAGLSFTGYFGHVKHFFFSPLISIYSTQTYQQYPFILALFQDFDL